MQHYFSYAINHDNASGNQYPTLLHALANLPHFPGAKIVTTERDITLELKDVDEIIFDMTRNRATRYKIDMWSVDGRAERGFSPIDCSYDQAVSWLIDNLEYITCARYCFDRIDMCGKYVLECEDLHGFYLTEAD